MSWPARESSPLETLHQRLSRYEERVSSTAILLQLLEMQLRQDILDAASMAEAQRISAAAAAAPRPVPLCVISRFESAVGAASETCVICDEGYREADACRLPGCGHVFHRPCVTTWLRLRSTCPLCRHKLPEVPTLKALEALDECDLRRQLGEWNLESSEGATPQDLAHTLFAHLSKRPEGEAAPPESTPGTESSLIGEGESANGVGIGTEGGLSGLWAARWGELGSLEGRASDSPGPSAARRRAEDARERARRSAAAERFASGADATTQWAWESDLVRSSDLVGHLHGQEASNVTNVDAMDRSLLGDTSRHSWTIFGDDATPFEQRLLGIGAARDHYAARTNRRS